MMQYQINNKTSYLQAVAELERSMGHLDIYNRLDTLQRFAIFSANLQSLMPETLLDEHEEWFRYFCLQQHLAHLDQNHPQALEVLKIKGLDSLFEGPLAPGPGIICSYHTGSYRLINKLMMQKGIPFALVVATGVLRNEGQTYLEVFREVTGQASSENFQLIDAEQPNALLQMLRALGKGMKLLVYVDGNSGTGETATSRNSCEVRFFDKRLFVRKGMGVLSYLSGFPLFPVLCKRLNATHIAFEIHQAIQPDRNLPRAIFAQQTMQQLYDYLQRQLTENPADWEGWRYVHHYLVSPPKGLIRLPEKACEAIKRHKWIL